MSAKKRSLTPAERRREGILKYLVEAEHSTIDALVSRFDVSLMTIHRDLDLLAQQGMVNKHHGGVSLEPSSMSSNVLDSAFSFRTHLAVSEKKALARAALQQIESGESVLLDDSTTVSGLAEILAEKAPLTVATNGQTSIEILGNKENVHLITLGGDFVPRFNASFGMMCERAIASLKVNVSVLSPSAVTDAVAYVQNPEVTQVKQAMMKSAEYRILLIASRKFHQTALHRLAHLNEFDLVLIDDGLEEEQRHQLERENVNFQLVSVTSSMGGDHAG